MDKTASDDSQNSKVSIELNTETANKLVEVLKDFSKSLRNIEYSIGNIERNLRSNY